MTLVVASLERICRVLTWISIGIISLLAFPMIYDVIVRTMGQPTIWAYEITTYALIAGTFLANAHALRDGKHFRVTFLLKSAPQLAWFLNRFALSVTLLFGLILTVAGWEYVQQAYSTNLHSPTLLNIPLYLPRLAIPLGGLSLTAQATINLLTGRYPDLHNLEVAE